MFSTLSQYYTGFFIEQSAGNNAFSYDARRNKRIYIPAVKAGGLEDLREGKQVVFSEVCNGREFNKTGLENYIYFQKKDKHIFIFDNHNHAFFFWMCAVKLGELNCGEIFVHIDQHTDMREPQKYLENLGKVSLDMAFQYTNKVLNVGNFIKPALALNVFKEVIMITNEGAFERTLNVPYALDLDMDIFSPEMNYISHDMKFNFIQPCLQSAKIITIATSPYFIKQNLAIALIKELFDF